MLKSKLIRFTLPLLLLFSNSSQNSVAGSKRTSPESQTGTLEKMIVADGSVTMDIDLNGLNGSSSLVARPVTVHFAVAANSFFPILVFNDLLRGSEPGSITLIPQNSTVLPSALGASINQLAVEKLASGEAFDLAVRDAKTGFVFFNIEGNLYGYDADAQLLTITGGRLLVSQEFANALGRPSDAGFRRWENLCRSSDATDRGHGACEWRSSIGGNASAGPNHSLERFPARMSLWGSFPD